MRRFICHIAIFLIALIAVMAVLDVVYTKIYENSAPRSKFQLLRSLKGKNVDCAFLGSSRVDNGIVPAIIKKETGIDAFNLGFQDSRLSDIHQILKIMDSYDISADTTFVQIDFIYNYGGHSKMMLQEVIPFVRDNAATKAYIGFLEDNQAIYYVPFYRYCRFDARIGIRELIMNIVKNPSIISADSGYNPIYGQSEKKDYPLPAYIVNSNPMADSIVSYRPKNGRRLHFFCAPFDRRTKNIGYIKSLQQKIPGLLDYSQAVSDSSSFWDYYHLNDQGAKQFTRIFAKKELKRKAP